MYGHSYSQSNEKEPQRPMVSYTNGAVKKCQPKSCDRNNLNPQRNGLMLKKVGNIRSELWMIHQPIIESSVALKKKCSRQQKQWCGRKHRKKGS